MKHFDDRQLKRCSILVIIGVALVVPIASLYVLYCIPAADVLARLSAVVGFSAVFAACLAVFTRARSVEVFAATAAYVFLCGCAAALLQSRLPSFALMLPVSHV